MASRSAPAQFGKIVAAAVLQFAALEQVPDTLVRIALRRLGRQLQQMHALGGACHRDVLGRLAAVDRCPIPHDQERAPDLAQELAEEGDNRWPVERPLPDVGEAPTIRGEGTDQRQLVVGEGARSSGGWPTGVYVRATTGRR